VNKSSTGFAGSGSESMILEENYRSAAIKSPRPGSGIAKVMQH
jgi:hypothetical protein